MSWFRQSEFEHIDMLSVTAVGAVVFGVGCMALGYCLHNTKNNLKNANIKIKNIEYKLQQTESDRDRWTVEAKLSEAQIFESLTDNILIDLKNYSRKNEKAKNFYIYLKGRKDQILAKKNDPIYLKDELINEYKYNLDFQSSVNYWGLRLNPRFASKFPLPEQTKK